MLKSNQWCEHLLLVTVRTPSAAYGFLLDCCSQEQFIEHWVSDYTREVVDLNVTTLSAASYESLATFWTPARVIEGE